MFQQTNSPSSRSLRFLALMLLLLPFLAGCTLGNLGSRSDERKQEAPPQPYHPAEFRDLLIPSELDFDRAKSMVVNTESFAGGVLHFGGRVEVNSLADFFTTTMPRNDWKLVGSVKHKDVLLAFTKPHKTCTIIINERAMGQSDVRIYITHDLSKDGGSDTGTPAKTTPFSF